MPRATRPVVREAIKSGPIHAFLADRLAGADAAAAHRRAELPATPLLPPPSGSDGQLVGTAIEYLIAGSLDARAKLPTGPHTRSLRDHRALQSAIDSAHSVIAHIGTDTTDSLVLKSACHAALVLAELEHRGRAGSSAPQWALTWRLPDGPPPTVCEATLVDLRRLAEAVIDDFEDLRGAEPLLFGPNLRSRARVRGDCDVVAGGLLIEIKSGKTLRSVLTRDVIWQVALYALADTDDAWQIHSVAVAAVRWRRWILWPLERLLHEVSGQNQSLASWRAELAAASE